MCWFFSGSTLTIFSLTFWGQPSCSMVFWRFLGPPTIVSRSMVFDDCPPSVKRCWAMDHRSSLPLIFPVHNGFYLDPPKGEWATRKHKHFWSDGFCNQVEKLCRTCFNTANIWSKSIFNRLLFHLRKSGFWLPSALFSLQECGLGLMSALFLLHGGGWLKSALFT